MPQVAESPVSTEVRPHPPSYPMHAWTHMPDYFKIPNMPSVNAYGVAYNVPLQEGDWSLEPMYKNASAPFLYHCKSRRVVDENLVDFRPPDGVMFGLHRTCSTRLDDADVWLQCTILTNICPATPGASALVVNDIMDFEKTYKQRRAFLESKFMQLGIKLIPDDKYAFLAPRFDEINRYHLWYGLHEINKMRQDIYAGMIAKRNDSMFMRNSTNPKQTTLWWMEHKFSEL